ncbi:MAG: hypothetical protein AVDCRST_MAG86-238 [uncultured Truepera sp.]|uniref:Uncharacterized protein n=1 Tax=uncultured Truepera sp. TaxID=543023 RepID=A0A6J4URV9_9DEIN|nr:MAG: hypothetical protein AVDCRST_MAG86-238 [uncultured Truepera sp.]
MQFGQDFSLQIAVVQARATGVAGVTAPARRAALAGVTVLSFPVGFCALPGGGVCRGSVVLGFGDNALFRARVLRFGRGFGGYRGCFRGDSRFNVRFLYTVRTPPTALDGLGCRDVGFTAHGARGRFRGFGFGFTHATLGATSAARCRGRLVGDRV